MEHTWYLSVFGVRGSLPAPGGDFAEYGGNTSCLWVDCGGEHVVLDAGSGLIPLSTDLWAQGCRRVHILLSHLHLDHVMGLFTSPLLQDPHVQVFLYGPGPGLEKQLSALVGPPWWPVSLAHFPALIQFQELTPGQRLALGPALTLDTLAGNHPGGSLLYRLEGAGRSLVYALDCELGGDMASRLEDFSQNCSLLIWDAAYAPEDLEQYRGWGHSSWAEGAETGRAAGAGLVLMTHYAWHYTDQFLQRQERLALEPGCPVLFAKEGMTISL